MPELPEVETTRRGIEPYLLNQTVTKIVVRQPQLRWPIPLAFQEDFLHQTLNSIQRRGKYLLLNTDNGTALIHLGMSGSLRIVSSKQLHQKHDHVDIHFSNNLVLRYTDPRRFGSILWTADDPHQHQLLINLGPEPLSADFNANYLWRRSRHRRQAIKQFLMNSHIVVGVGNIYANESLFKAKIHPTRAAGKISLKRYQVLIEVIQETLKDAIQQGGTTLKDFVNSDGKPGYFSQHLQVYGRGDQPCFCCGKHLSEIRLGQRTTVFCSNCQR